MNATVTALHSAEAPSVHLQGDTLHVHDLDLDGTIVELARERASAGEDPEATLRRALEVGAAVLAHGQSKSTMDAVAAEVGRLTDSIGAGAQSIDAARRATIEGVSGEVTRLLAGASSRHESMEQVRDATMRGVKAEVERLLSAMEERAVRTEAVRRTVARSSSKGACFEESLAPAIDACYSPYGDILEQTSTLQGIAAEKTGDFVLTVNPKDTGGSERRVVFEAKDRSLSMTKSLAELDAAMANRDASVGVMVFAHSEQSPLAGKPLRALPGNRLICVWDPEQDDSELTLEVCCQLARSLALADEREDGALDRGDLSDKLSKLTGVIDRANAILRGVRTARRGLDQTEEAYQQMVADANGLLAEIQGGL